MKRKRLVPFKMLPASWGLTGKTRKIAEAEYYYTYPVLDYVLASIEHEDGGIPLALAELELDLRYNKVDKYRYDNFLLDLKLQNEDISEYDCAIGKLDTDLLHGHMSKTEHRSKKAEVDLQYEVITSEEHQIELLSIKLLEGTIEQHEYDNEVATIKDEPYVNVISMGIENSAEGYFELDWNDNFVKMLYEEGLTGVSDEDVVNKWFNRICKTVLLQEGADLDFGMQQPLKRDRPDVEYRRDSESQDNQNDGRDSTDN